MNALDDLSTAYQASLHTPGNDDLFHALNVAARTAAAALATIHKCDLAQPEIGAAWELAAKLAALPAREDPTPDEELELAQTYLLTGWSGTLAAALIARPWEITPLPLDQMPQAWWGAYTRWAFAMPVRSAARIRLGNIATHAIRQVQDLAIWTERNLGSIAVQAAVHEFLQRANPDLGSWSEVDQLAWQVARGKIIQRVHRGPTPQPEISTAAPRKQRCLRLGLISASSDEINPGLIPPNLSELIEENRFEVHAFAAPTESAQPLAAELVAARLDVLIYATPSPDWSASLQALATTRQAPLQIAVGPVTTGFLEIDVLFTTERANVAPTSTTERALALPLPSLHCRREIEPSPPASSGLADSIVLLALIDPRKMDQETRETLLSFLCTHPAASVHLAPVEPLSAIELAAVRAQWKHDLTTAGLAEDRVIIRLDQHDHPLLVPQALAAADIVIDLPGSYHWLSLEGAATGQRPVVALRGEPDRNHEGATLLQALGQSGDIATSDEEFSRLVASLVNDAALRHTKGAHLQEAWIASDALPDALAITDLLSGVIEKAFDALITNGRARFRRATSALGSTISEAEADQAITAGEAALATHDAHAARRHALAALERRPTSSAARFLLGRSLVPLGHAQRAVLYLAAALNGHEHEAARWLALAQAFRANAQIPQTLEAMGGCLQVDPTCLEGWVLMGELAHGIGATEITAEALSAAQQLDPHDARVIELADLLNRTSGDNAEVDPFQMFAKSGV